MIPFSQTASGLAWAGTVDSFKKISDTSGDFAGVLDDGDLFGRDVDSIGDLDGDGVDDLVVSAVADDDGGTDHGAVYILFMETDGTTKAGAAGFQKISDTAGGFTGTLAFQDFFGSAVANLGDLDGAGPSVRAIAVGAVGDGPGAGGGSGKGAVWILFLDSAGMVLSHNKINDSTLPGSPLDAGDSFGQSVRSIGDIDGDGVTDIGVGADLDDDGSFDAGTVYIIFLKTDGTEKGIQKLSNTVGGLAAGTFAQQDQAGFSVTNMGDLDGNGADDLAVGGAASRPGNTSGGEVDILFLKSDGTGTAISSKQITSGVGGFAGGSLDDDDQFSQVQNVGDLNGDGVNDLAVGTQLDDDGGPDRGAVWILHLKTDGTVSSQNKISDTAGGFTGVLDDGDNFGFSVANLGDLNGDGVTDLAVGAPLDDDTDGTPGDVNRGAVWILFLKNTDGCSSGHWKNDARKNGAAGDWADAGLDPAVSKLQDFFDDFPTLTGLKGSGDKDDPLLVEALNTKKGKINALAREAAAAVLNEASSVDYSLTLSEIQTIVNDALTAGTDADYNAARDLLFPLNHAGCPL